MYTCYFSCNNQKKKTKQNKNWNYGLSNPSNQQPQQLIAEIMLYVIYFHLLLVFLLL